MEVRFVPALNGWKWLVEAFALFRKDPGVWVGIVILLYVVLTLLVRVPVLGVVVVLFVPALLAGMMQGCRALESGERLKVAHLFSGFQKNPGALVTLGGVSLVGNLGLLMLLTAMSGDAVTEVMKGTASGAADPAAAEAILRAAPSILRAALVVMVLSLPLLMALWFAPLLVHFDGLRPGRALFVSLWACWKNPLPFLVYGLAVLSAMVVLTPFSVAFRQADLSLWLLAPVLVPSIYTSYRDLFVPRAEAPAEAPAQD